MARQLKRLGHATVGDPQQAQVLIVNTCGFIADAREESIAELEQLARQKRPGQVLVAAGCLAQRWGDDLLAAVPGIDGLLGTRRWNEIEELVRELHSGQGSPEKKTVSWLGDPLLDAQDSYRVARQEASAYLKIADGCSAPCAFCAIPLIKGPAHSRNSQDIIQDAVELVQGGVREIILIAQDSTAYGRDRGQRDALPDLMRAILEAVPYYRSSQREGLAWLRLMYAYPGHISPMLIEIMASDPRVCHYLDLPLQHAHPDTLKRMRRPANIGRTRQTITHLRNAMPNLALRTSFIVGFPGETDLEFETLLSFVEDVRFDRVGVFLYSHEEGTAAAILPDAVPENVKRERLERLMEVQQQISLESNQAQVGRQLDVLVEGHGDGLSIGRTYRDAPEVDGLVLIPADVTSGQIVPVQITGAMEYDLTGEVLS
jgi:ribosomal protein S12 methylthiotransferase